ncbi:MAG: hypothetical protein M3N08_04685 [Pseudomonadota bacterium]|nr:hypothetical protein [Pseudomonadota bacterium]
MMPQSTLTDDQMARLVRNALIVAGTEMGTEGDHWPVINATIHSVMKDWENLKIERRVHEEMRNHLYAQLDRMDEIVEASPESVRRDVAPKLKTLREIYDAHFAPTGLAPSALSDEETPAHVRRAQNIIQSMEDDDG